MFEYTYYITVFSNSAQFSRKTLNTQIRTEPYNTYNLVSLNGKRPPLEALQHQLVNNQNAFKLTERINPPVTFPAFGNQLT